MYLCTVRVLWNTFARFSKAFFKFCLKWHGFLFFNVHHQFCLSSALTDHPGEQAFNSAILHDLEQLMQISTRILTDLEINPIHLVFSLPLTLLLMLICTLSQICILYYLSIPSSVSFKVKIPLPFYQARFREPKVVLCWFSPGMITVSVSDTHLYVLNA